MGRSRSCQNATNVLSDEYFCEVFIHMEKIWFKFWEESSAGWKISEFKILINVKQFSFILEKREEKETETDDKRYTITSKLTITPTANDDYTEYSCQAKHKALQPDMPKRATVQLSVLCKYWG